MHNLREFDHLRIQSALCSRWHKAPTSTIIYKPIAGNLLYKLLAVVLYLLPIFVFNFIPMIMSNAEAEKMTGQSLNGRKSTLNPVNKDRIANVNSILIIKT